MGTPQKRKAEEAETSVTTKKQKPAPPKHGKRLFINAVLCWHDQHQQHTYVPSETP